MIKPNDPRIVMASAIASFAPTVKATEMSTENVLPDLDELIESLRGSADAEYSTDSASPAPNCDMKTLVTLTTLRARLAALVEAAEKMGARHAYSSHPDGRDSEIVLRFLKSIQGAVHD